MKEFVTIGYEFSELGPEAAERAHYDWLDAGANDFDHHYILDDITECGAALGIVIDDIHYSGFFSQGDGACFVGHYKFKPDWKATVDNLCPGYTQLIALGERLQQAYEKYGELSAVVYKTNHRYEHENAVTIDVENDPAVEDFPTLDAQETIEGILKDFMREIYRRLREEYEYSCSLEYFKERAEDNEWYFTEEGKLIR